MSGLFNLNTSLLKYDLDKNTKYLQYATSMIYFLNVIERKLYCDMPSFIQKSIRLHTILCPQKKLNKVKGLIQRHINKQDRHFKKAILSFLLLRMSNSA